MAINSADDEANRPALHVMEPAIKAHREREICADPAKPRDPWSLHAFARRDLEAASGGNSWKALPPAK